MRLTLQFLSLSNYSVTEKELPCGGDTPTFDLAPAKYAANYSFFCRKYIFLVNSWRELVCYYVLL